MSLGQNFLVLLFSQKMTKFRTRGTRGLFFCLSLLVWISLVGCTSTRPMSETEFNIHSPLAEITVTTIPVVLTSPSVANIPTALPTEPISTVEITAQPTTITLTATSKPSPTSSALNLPSWITEPSANILLLGNSQTRTATLFHIDNQERYEIPITIRDLNLKWLWQEDNYWLNMSYLQTGQSVRMIDIVTGEIVRTSSIRRDIPSPDSRHSAHIVSQLESDSLVTIIDHETGMKSELINPFLHLQSRDEAFNESVWTVYWSPDGTYLAVLYDKHYIDDNYERNLVIYTPTGDIIQQYANADTSWTNPWSPVAPYLILYTDGWTPCILDIVEEKQDCLEFVTEWLAIRNVSTFNYIWSPDGEKISFVYGNSDELKTGMCYIELITESIVCPISTDDLALDRQLFTRIHYWSPDANYVAVFADTIGFMDVIGPMKVAIVDIDRQTFRLLEEEYSWPFNDVWRPPMPRQTTE